MDDIRFKNIYDAFYSHIDFCNYIESFGEENVDIKKINYDLLSSIFCGLYFTTILDKYIVKTSSKNIEFKIVPDFLNFLVSQIAIDNGKGYTVGELSYKDSSTVLGKIRNKLAHGDFIVDNGNIIFEENNKKGIIEINKLVSVIANLDFHLKDYVLEDNNTMKNANLKYVINREVHGESSFKKLCKDIYILTIEEKPKKGRTRNMQYVNFVNNVKNKVFDIFSNDALDDKNIKQFLEKNKFLLDALGIDLTYKIQSVYDLSCYEQIKKEYFEGPEMLKLLQGGKLARYIINRALKLSKGNFQTFNYSKGISIDLLILKSLKENMSLHDILTKNEDLEFVLFTDIDNAIIAANIAVFCSFYQYGLEKGFTEKGNYDLAKLVTGKSLDFSKLDLDMLYDPNMKIEHNFKSYNYDIEKYERKSIRLLDVVGKCRLALTMYKEHTPDNKISQKRLNILKKDYIDAYERYINNIFLINDMKKFKDTFDLDKYVRNINIIEHIRNAIAHGNIYVDECNNMDNVIEKKIIIKDCFENNESYYKEVTIHDFNSLFKMRNFYQIYNFITANIRDKTLINDNYLNQINSRINQRNKVKKIYK